VASGKWKRSDRPSIVRRRDQPEVPELPYALIVKEVECSLQEPKPLRLVEMRRMMILCRDKVGAVVEKDTAKKAITYLRKH